MSSCWRYSNYTVNYSPLDLGCWTRPLRNRILAFTKQFARSFTQLHVLNSKVSYWLLYASPLVLIDWTELHLLREMLMHKFGRDFSLAVMENRDDCVSPRVSHVPLKERISSSIGYKETHYRDTAGLSNRCLHGRDCARLWCTLHASRSR